MRWRAHARGILQSGWLVSNGCRLGKKVCRLRSLIMLTRMGGVFDVAQKKAWHRYHLHHHHHTLEQLHV